MALFFHQRDLEVQNKRARGTRVAVGRSLIQRRISMANISRICATSKGTTIDAIGQGRYRVCNRQEVCSEVEGLWQAYETLRRQDQSLG